MMKAMTSEHVKGTRKRLQFSPSFISSDLIHRNYLDSHFFEASFMFFDEPWRSFSFGRDKEVFPTFLTRTCLSCFIHTLKVLLYVNINLSKMDLIIATLQMRMSFDTEEHCTITTH